MMILIGTIKMETNSNANWLNATLKRLYVINGYLSMNFESIKPLKLSKFGR